LSERNIELVRRLGQAHNARDVEAFIALCDRDVEFHTAYTAVGGGVYHGHDGVRKFFADLEDAWGDEIRNEPEALFDLGEQVLVFNVMRARGRQSGAEVAMPLTQVTRWRDGLIVHWKSYTHREDALRDLGVSEDELEPIAP
jgi:ketosteroid isomerase-like protein